MNVLIVVSHPDDEVLGAAALARSRFLPIGSGHNRRTLVYDRDVANAVLLALRHPAAAGHIYNVTDGQFHTLQEIITTLSVALGRRPPRLSLPVGPTRWAAGALEDVAQLIGLQSPIVRATIDKYTEDIAVDGRPAGIGLRPAVRFGNRMAGDRARDAKT